MKDKIVKSLILDIIFLFILLFWLSRIEYICQNIPAASVPLPVIWFLYGVKFIFKKDFYGGVINNNILNRCGYLCFLMGFLSLVIIIGLFIQK